MISQRVQDAAQFFSTLHNDLDENFCDYSVYHDSLHFYCALGVSLPEEQKVLAVEWMLGGSDVPNEMLNEISDLIAEIPSELLEEYANFFYDYYVH